MKAKSKIILLTNPSNEDPKEDLFLYEKLKPFFYITFCHPLDTEKYENDAALFLIRNIWPTHVYQKEFEKTAKRWKQKHIQTFNTLNGRADYRGKNYLRILFKQAYPVVPTYTIVEAKQRLQAKNFLIKPLFGADGSGTRIVSTLKDVKSSSNYIVQPVVAFKEELAFYFLDNVFQYALRFKNKLQSHSFKIYYPSQQEIQLAQRFIDWNTMSKGIQRVDALRTKDSVLLVNEIEDFCPYLYLEDLPKKILDNFIKQLIITLNRYV